MSTAPPFDGEGPHALWHFSEDPGLSRFEPHVAPTSPREDALVWAISTRASPGYWFPRDCPRACVWVTDDTTVEDRVRFLGHSSSPRLHVMESAWVERMQACVLYAYRLPEQSFSINGDPAAGHYVSREPVDAIERVEVGDLFALHASSGIELRITPDIWPFWHSVIYSTFHFSGTRLANTTVPQPPLPKRYAVLP